MKEARDQKEYFCAVKYSFDKCDVDPLVVDLFGIPGELDYVIIRTHKSKCIAYLK